MVSIPSKDELDAMEAHRLMSLLNDVLLESEEAKKQMQALKDMRKAQIQERADAKKSLLLNGDDVDTRSRLIQAQATLDILKIEGEKLKETADLCKLQSSILQTTINTQVRLAR